MTSRSDTVPQAVGDESNATQPSMPKSPKGRRRLNKPMTAERRMQNCRAQRAYRQRKRERLRELEAKVASLGRGKDSEVVSGQDTVTPLATSASNLPQIQEESSPSHDPPTAASSLQPYANSSPWTYDSGNAWLEHLPSTSFAMEMMGLPSTIANESQPMVAENPSTESFSALLHLTETEASTSTPAEASNTAGFTGSSSSSLFSIYRPSSRPLSSRPQLIRKWFQLLPQSTRRLLAQLARDGYFSFIDMISSSLFLANTNSTNRNGQGFEGSDLRTTQRRVSEIRFATSPVSSYSPYRNSLRIARFSYFAALFTNFSSLGFDFGLFLDERSVSPFCTSRANEDANTSTSTTIQAHDIPLNLRPIPTQYTVTHHPYIDSLPFPTFRRRALAALAADPPLLDEDDLCLDLMLHDGLVCWGSASQNGMDHGTPWDSQSWEAKEWFLRKWKWLVGGKEGELWHSSRWWAAQRGEIISI
ncbi:hypothetical protein BBK36DRAFT_1175250 [Trichoderma citrinoviride]|uniref:BZIP domain-containing protein n=1 Tax=Trichoderma citrinoviride TaxID=58853 RepID=A0A2T4BN11_9HYPO|nr:hypothetical protein BBK36DRAFT_1175250 [Trichoderma citrinoviride]PTB70708.1 hypothetical protein BBK36DRAFT_1175250 [Trichoderma citrinoviride]